MKPLCLQTLNSYGGEWFGSAALNALLLDIAERSLLNAGAASTIAPVDRGFPETANSEPNSWSGIGREVDSGPDGGLEMRLPRKVPWCLTPDGD